MNKPTIRLILIIFISITLLASCQEKTNKESSNASLSSNTSEKTEVLIIGTFHFSNFDPKYNQDLIQTSEVDVMTEQNQKELELISNKIAKFKPSKIFLEAPYSEQAELDSMYNAFVPENYDQKNRDEGDQFAFRVAKKLGHKKLFATDFRDFSFPGNSMRKSMENANQQDLIALDDLKDEQWEKDYNELVNKNHSLLDVLYFLNSSEERKIDRAWYLNYANKAGSLNDTIGTFLASEWYRRNLHIYSKIQKQVTEKDERIMILLGSSHIAILKDFIDNNPKWKTVELKEVMENN